MAWGRRHGDAWGFVLCAVRRESGAAGCTSWGRGVLGADACLPAILMGIGTGIASLALSLDFLPGHPPLLRS